MQDEIVDLIIKQIRRSATEEEKETLLSWLQKSEENRRFYSLFAANYNLHDTLTSETLSRDTESMIARLNARIDAAPPSLFSRKSWRMGGLALAFAALVLAVIMVIRPGVKASQAIPMQELANQTSETIHLVLEDGTRVYLAPGASLSYNVTTLPESREVRLSGDAYFDVMRNEDKPFFVRTGNIGVKVLGTAFSVSSSPDVSQVVLERGMVRLISPEGASMVTLNPNQKATFRTMTGDVMVEPVYATAFVTDKYSLMAISDATLPQILARLSSVYKKKVHGRGGNLDKRYNLAFLKSDTLEDVLSMLEYMTGAEFEID